MKRIRRLAWVGILCLWAYRTAAAQVPGQILLDLDPAATRIEFTLGSLLHTVHGNFALKQGSIRVDLANGTTSGQLVVDARSGGSGNQSRDRRMHKEILDSEHYPEFVFIPDHVTGKVELDGTSEVQIHGLLQIHGKTHKMDLPVKTQMVQGQLTATTTFALPYVKWGMKNPSTLFLKVNEDVDIKVRARGHISTASGPGS